VNRSDCQSWLGSARSKRFGVGCGFGLALGLFCVSPSALSTRRTVVSDAPIPKNRRITSRIRRLPAEGCAALTSKIARRRGLSGPRLSRFGVAAANSAFSPPLR